MEFVKAFFFLENIFSKNKENLPQKIIGIPNQKNVQFFFKKKKTMLLTLSTYLPTYLNNMLHKP